MNNVHKVNFNTKVKIGWKITLIIFGIIGLLTCFIKIPGFWSSYVLDIVGPAWNYILLRGIYSSKVSTFPPLKLTPAAAASTIFIICFVIETSQYFKLYDAHFDLYDYIAYISLLLPVYLVDNYLLKSVNEGKKGS